MQNLSSKPLKLAVLIGGSGRTLQNFIDLQKAGKLDVEIRLVIASRPGLAGSDRAMKAGLRHEIVNARDFPGHDAATAASQRIFELGDEVKADLVCLAGWLSLLVVPPRYVGRVMNIHPALLPNFGGKGMYGHKVHQAVIDAGCRVSGCTVHFVDDKYDNGPIILQRVCPVLEEDSADSLAARIFEEEKIAYPQAIRMFQENLSLDIVSTTFVNPSPFLKRLMKAVAPEKSNELQQLLNDLRITFSVNDSQHRIYFTASERGNGNHIEFGLRCVWRLWANAYAYFCIYDEVRSAKLLDPSSLGLDLETTPRLLKASKLLWYAVTTDIETQIGNASPFDVLNLPEGLPVPFSPSARASDEHVADEIALVAIGFILHHELAHLRLSHQPCKGYDSIRQEKEADMAAANWLLDSKDLDPMARLKREIGVAVGLGWFASLNIYIPFKGNTHPPAYERLYQVLDQHVEDPNSPVWAMVVTLLGLHLQNQQIEYGQAIEFSSFKECANHYVNVISKLKV